MKTCTVFAASAVLAVVSIDSAMGMASYLKELPNGDSFSKALGHKCDSGYTDFGTAFSKAGAKWSTDFCKQTFPGTSMTNGAVFGDPCCTWTAGGKPDFTVTAFTDKPTQETKCASAATHSTTPAASAAAPSTAPSQADSPSSKKPIVRPTKCGVKKEPREIVTTHEKKYNWSKVDWSKVAEKAGNYTKDGSSSKKYSVPVRAT